MDLKLLKDYFKSLLVPLIDEGFKSLLITINNLSNNEKKKLLLISELKNISNIEWKNNYLEGEIKRILHYTNNKLLEIYPLLKSKFNISLELNDFIYQLYINVSNVLLRIVQITSQLSINFINNIEFEFDKLLMNDFIWINVELPPTTPLNNKYNKITDKFNEYLISQKGGDVHDSETSHKSRSISRSEKSRSVSEKSDRSRSEKSRSERSRSRSEKSERVEQDGGKNKDEILESIIRRELGDDSEEYENYYTNSTVMDINEMKKLDTEKIVNKIVK